MVCVEVHGEQLVILADRAVYWAARRTLFVADLHLGKSSTFVAAGIPVPDTTRRTLERLGALLDATAAERLVVLGDLIHARAGRTQSTMDAVTQWRAERAAIPMVLVRGNHDAKAGDPPREWNIQCEDAPWHEAPFSLCHTPEECGLGSSSKIGPTYGLCGHVHPVHVVGDGGVSSVRASCLWMTPTHAVLPAFGDFTGGQRIRPVKGDRVFLYGREQVMEVPCV